MPKSRRGVRRVKLWAYVIVSGGEEMLLGYTVAHSRRTAREALLAHEDWPFGEDLDGLRRNGYRLRRLEVKW